MHIIDRSASHNGMHAARIITDHSAQRTPAVCGGIRTKGETMFFGLRSKIVEHKPGLNPSKTLIRINFDNLIKIFRKVHKESDIHALPGNTRSATTTKHRYAVFPCRCDRSDHIINGLRYYDTDRYLSVVRCIRRIQSTRTFIEANLSFQSFAKVRFKGSSSTVRDLKISHTLST